MSYGTCTSCKARLLQAHGYAGTDLCGPCCTGEAETAYEVTTPVDDDVCCDSCFKVIGLTFDREYPPKPWICAGCRADAKADHQRDVEKDERAANRSRP